MAHRSPASCSRGSTDSKLSSRPSLSFSRQSRDSFASRSVRRILWTKSAVLDASSASDRLFDTESAARTSWRHTVSLGKLVNRLGQVMLTPVLNLSARCCSASVRLRASEMGMESKLQMERRSIVLGKSVAEPRCVAGNDRETRCDAIKNFQLTTSELRFQPSTLKLSTRRRDILGEPFVDLPPDTVVEHVVMTRA